MNRTFTYFASDFHLGVPDIMTSLEREKRIVGWLDKIKNNAHAIYLVGDLFDFWFEYKYVVPKGHIRLLGKLAELADSGIELHIFHGNHDLWQFGYLEKELGCKVHHSPLLVNISGKRFYIAHGDGLGPGQRWFKFVLSVYRNSFFQRLFAFFHPSIGMRLANWFSHRSKMKPTIENGQYLGDEKEYLFLHAADVLRKDPVDYFIFGHRHLSFNRPLNGARVVNLGDWFTKNTYAVYDGENVKLITE